MCGILAYISTSRPLPQNKIIHSLNTLSHRGPDASNYWATEDRLVALGHVRLSIIDLDYGAQPLHSQDGSIHAVVNGEFYGYEDIRAELCQKGYRFKTHSDSEILIALYQEYGVDCLSLLRGEFAFILWDDRQKRLFAARDRFGIKPLFYSLHEGAIYFASEAKALFSMGVPCHWNTKIVHSHEYFLPSQSHSLFDNISAITPGHFLLATEKELKLHCYWDFNYPADASELYQDDDEIIIEQFRHVLEEAVELRLRADVPVGCYLSGGLDSCSVLGLMSHIRQTPIDTFTISFNEALYDEAAIAEEMSRLVGSNHHCYAVDEAMLRDNFYDAIYHNETFIFNNNTVAKFLLSRYTQQAGYKVILTGEGSDEILAGYPIFREDMLRYDNTGQDEKIISELIEQLHEKNKASHGLFSTSEQNIELAQAETLLGYIPAMFKATSSGGKVVASLHTQDFKNLVEGFNPLHDFFNSLNWHQLTGRSPLIKSLYLWSKSILPGYILVQLGDRMEMAHSLEGRVPFLDHRVVEFLTKVPNHLKINGLNEKFILREAVKDLITDTVYKRQKHPFLAPPSSVKESPFRSLMAETFNSDSLKYSPFYDQKKVLSLFNESKNLAPMKQQELDKIFMHVLSVCAVNDVFKPSLSRLTTLSTL